MSYLFKSILYVLGFIYLSATKGWAALVLLFVCLPILVLWILLLAFMGRKNHTLRDKIFNNTLIPAMILSFTTIGLGDTDEVTAFTFMVTTNMSIVAILSLAVSLIALLVFIVNAVRGTAAIFRTRVK